jgi:hypothetical protein
MYGGRAIRTPGREKVPLGLIMALFVILLPEGLTGLIARLGRRRTKAIES